MEKSRTYDSYLNLFPAYQKNNKNVIGNMSEINFEPRFNPNITTKFKGFLQPHFSKLQTSNFETSKLPKAKNNIYQIYETQRYI